MEIVRNTHFDFLGKTRLWVAISVAAVAVSVGYVVTKGVRTGVEFSGGTQVIAKFQSRPALDRVRAAVEEVAPGATIQTYDEPGKNQVLIRVATVVEGELDQQAQKVLQQLAAKYGENPLVESSTEIVGPIVGQELRSKAIRLTALGLLFQLVYIGFRFNGFVWGSAATIAVLHDVVVTLGLLAIFRYDITLNVIAALLTLVGYSVNDTIVIFDRVRENLRQRRKEPLAKLINDSLNQTLSRTLISNGTTFLTVLGLFLFGGEVLRGFAFTMVVGIIVGSYSTIYIASPVVIFWQGLLQKRPPSAKAAL